MGSADAASSREERKVCGGAAALAGAANPR